MVTFTHDQESTAEAEWLNSPRISGMLALNIDWTTVEKLIVVAAHPDDETLGAAGLIHRAACHHVAIDVIVATLGENSHPLSPTHTPKQLAGRRAFEFQDAVTVVAPQAHHRVLDLPDGQLAEHSVQLEQELIAAAGSGGRTTVIVAPWSSDGHTDHDAAGAAAIQAAAATGSRLLEYPIWWWHWGSPADHRVAWPALRKLELSKDEQTLKAEAVSKHTTQVSPLSDADGDETLLSPALLSHFERSFETFIDMAGHFTQAGNDEPEWICTQFDAVHLDGAEPWAPESWYERRKRSLVLAALPHERFAAALELGCSTGALTAQLAPRCGRITGVDASGEAVATATKRLTGVSNADVSQSILGRDWPQGRFDLYVLSETGYYLAAAALEEVVARIVGSALPDAYLVACHWRHPINGWPLGGDDVHQLLRAHKGLTLRGAYAEGDFLLEVFRVQANL